MTNKNDTKLQLIEDLNFCELGSGETEIYDNLMYYKNLIDSLAAYIDFLSNLN